MRHQIALTADGLDELGRRCSPAGELAEGSRSAGGAALHGRHIRRTKGGDAQPPCAAQSSAQPKLLRVLEPDDVLLALVPLFHVFGLNAVLGSALMSGARLVIMDGFDGFVDVVAEEKITNLPVAPAVLTRDSFRRARHGQRQDGDQGGVRRCAALS